MCMPVPLLRRSRLTGVEVPAPVRQPGLEAYVYPVMGQSAAVAVGAWTETDGLITIPEVAVPMTGGAANR